jgi:hypothetical protein
MSFNPRARAGANEDQNDIVLFYAVSIHAPARARTRLN